MRYTQPLSSILHLIVPSVLRGENVTSILMKDSLTPEDVNLIDADLNPDECSISQNCTVAAFNRIPKLDAIGNVW